MKQFLSSPLLSSPVAFFCYDRPEHTRRTLEALANNHLASQSKLFIFSDGFKDETSRLGVEAVREYISSVNGFASVEIILREENYGCAKNIIQGITQLTYEFGRVIVVEDDILTSPYFLTYMNEGLELYKDDERVGAISGVLSPSYKDIAEKLPQSFFMYGVGIWGWGTWLRAWRSYDYDAWNLLKRIRAAGLEDKYNYGLKHKPRTRNLVAQGLGRVGTWDYQLVAGEFLHGRVTLYPGRSLTNNIGCDGTGEHCGVEDYEATNMMLAEEYESLKKIPVEVDKDIYEVFLQKFRQNNPSRSLLHRAARKIWRILSAPSR